MKIAFVGSGNVAHFFAQRLQFRGHEISQIYSRTRANGLALSRITNAALTDSLDQLTPDADVYFLAIKDDALAGVAARLQLKDKIAIHCAGALPVDILEQTTPNCAVMWTLYSVRKNNLPTLPDVPLIVEASNVSTLKTVLQLAHDISDRVVQADYEKRAWLHLNAVLVNNFTNHLLAIAETICQTQQLPFDILQPIIQQTIAQIKFSSALQNQTGPALRHDSATIKKHESLLREHPEWQRLYAALTTSIQAGFPGQDSNGEKQ